MFFLTSLRRWWRDRGRNIFSYHDGIKTRYADPVAIGTALERECPHYQELLDVIDKKTADVPPGPVRDSLIDQQRASIKKLSMVARTVFGLPQLDTETGWGATDAHAIQVLISYFIFMERLARKAELFQTSPEPVLESPPA